MAMIRGSIRWCKARLCTGLLVVVFFAVAWFALSASYHSLHPAPEGGFSEGEDAAGQSRWAGEGRGRNGKGGFEYVDDDDEVQICKYPLVAEAGSLVVTDDAWETDDAPEGCGQHSDRMFYFKDGSLRAHEAGTVKGVRRCEYRGIDRKSDSEFVYTEKHPIKSQTGLEVGINHDFVHVQCFGDSGTVQDSGRSHKDKRDTHRADRDEIVSNLKDSVGKAASSFRASRISQAESKDETKVNSEPGQSKYNYKSAKDFHRSVVHQNSPRLVGSLGLPDFRDNFLERRAGRESQQTGDSRQLLSAQNGQNQDSNLEELDAPDEEHHKDEEHRNDEEHHEDEEHRNADAETEEKIAEVAEHESDPKTFDFDQNQVERSPHRNQANVDADRPTSFPIVDQFLVQVAECSETKESAEKLLEESGQKSRMNVLILALDSISRTSFETNFRRSSQFLKEKLRATVMNGYTSLGDAATAAVIPLLTGLKEAEVSEKKRSGHEAQYVDAMSFIWNRYEQKGYVSLFAEDQPALGTFQTHFYGFEDNPVHHYMRPFWLAASDSQLHSESRPNCLGSASKHQYVFEYISDFFKKYASLPKFAFGFLSEFDRSRTIDDDLTKFLERLVKERHLDNTLLIVLGDHGKSYGEGRDTLTGKLEESQPYLSIAFPSEFQAKHGDLMSKLRGNRDRLTTAFDVYRTLVSLLDIDSTKNAVNATARSISLLQQIPRQRTCRLADIDLHWCTCVKYERISDSDLEAAVGSQMKDLANVAVKEINRLIENEDMSNLCARPTLGRLLSARKIFPNELVFELEGKLVADRPETFNLSRRFPASVRYHQIVFTASPNDAVFEATIDAGDSSTSGSAVVNGQISRISAYGRQSDCIIRSHPDLRKYCQCVSRDA